MPAIQNNSLLRHNDPHYLLSYLGFELRTNEAYNELAIGLLFSLKAVVDLPMQAILDGMMRVQTSFNKLRKPYTTDLSVVAKIILGSRLIGPNLYIPLGSLNSRHARGMMPRIPRAARSSAVLPLGCMQLENLHLPEVG